MKRLGKAVTAVAVTAALTFATTGPAFASTPEVSSQGAVNAQSQEALHEALNQVLSTKSPVAVRAVGEMIEKDYEFGSGSILTITQEKLDLPDGVASSAVSAGQDSNGFYIEFSAADQGSIFTGGIGAVGALLGAIFGPFGATLVGIIGASVGPQLAAASCSSSGKAARFYYTLDGNATSVQCV